MTAPKILDLTPLGMKFTVLKNAEATNGRSLDLHWDLSPGCNMKDALIHTHPHAIETYEVLEGEMEFYVKNEWIRAKTGDKLTVPIGVAHTFRNPGDSVVKVYNTHEPAFRMEEYFEAIERILNKLTENRRKEFNMNLKAKLYMGVLMNDFRHEIIAVDPPDAVIRVMGVIGKLVGVKY